MKRIGRNNAVSLQEKGGVAAGDKVYGIRDEVKWGALKIVNSPTGSMLKEVAQLHGIYLTGKIHLHIKMQSK